MSKFRIEDLYPEFIKTPNSEFVTPKKNSPIQQKIPSFCIHGTNMGDIFKKIESDDLIFNFQKLKFEESPK